MTILLAMAGWFAADLATAVIHWFLDHGYGPRKWVREFAMHHARPDWTGHVWQPVVPGVGLMLIGMAGSPAFWVAFGVGLAVAQTAHVWSHRTNRAARLLQRLGVILPPEHHANHHSSPSRNFGVLNGWSNYVVNLFTRGAP